jgi:hypothetical protein
MILPDGTAPIEIFAMEAKLNSKEFLKFDTLKCDGKSHLMACHRDIGFHGSMWGVFIPPSFYPQPEYPLGPLCDKR